MLSTGLFLYFSKSILLMSGISVHDVVVHIFDANFLLNNSLLSMLLLPPVFCRNFSVLTMLLFFSVSLFHSLVVRLFVADVLTNVPFLTVVAVAVGATVDSRQFSSNS